MDSSWIQFGPAGRGSYDWVAGAPTQPSTENRLQGYWNELTSTKAEDGAEVTLYVLTVTGSLLFLSGIAFVLYRCFRGQESTTEVITLDLDDANGTAEFLSTLEEGGGSEDGNDGVFLMVYLSAPYEKTLTRIARAASTSSSHNDVEIVELDSTDHNLTSNAHVY